MITSGGVESRHAGTQPLRCPIGREGNVKPAAAGVAPGPLTHQSSSSTRGAYLLLDLFIRYRPLAWAALIVALLCAYWLGDGGVPSW